MEGSQKTFFILHALWEKILPGVSDISYPMLVAAARAIANHTKPGDLIPNPLDPSVHKVVARAVEQAAQEQNYRKPFHSIVNETVFVL